MARQRKRKETAPEIPAETSGEDLIQEPLSLFDDMAEDSIVMVWRRHALSKKPVFLFALAPEEANEIRIQELAGGGVFVCKERIRNDRGQMVWSRQRTVEIGGPQRDPPEVSGIVGRKEKASAGSAAPSLPGVGPSPGTAPGAVSTSDIMNAGLLQLFQANKEVSAMQAESFRALAAQVANAGRSTVEWGPILTALAPVALELVRGKSGEGKGEILEMLEKVVTLVKSSTGPASSFKEQLEIMNDLLDLKDRRTPPVSEDEGMMGVIGSGLNRLLEVIQEEQARRRGAPVTAKAPGVKPGTAPTPAALPNTPKWQAVLGPWRKQLVGLASSGKDAETTANFHFMVMPDPMRGTLREFLMASPDPVGALCDFLPELVEYRSWVEDYVGTMADHFGLLDVDEDAAHDGGTGESEPEGGEADAPEVAEA